MFVNNRSAASTPKIILAHGIKWGIFMNLSSTTNVELKPFVSGRSEIKFIEMEAHGRIGLGGGWNKQ